MKKKKSRCYLRLSCLQHFKQTKLTQQSIPGAHEESRPALSLVSGIHLEPPFSKCGPQTSILSITWELVRNANFQALPRPIEARMLQVESRATCFISLPGACDAP